MYQIHEFRGTYSGRVSAVLKVRTFSISTLRDDSPNGYGVTVTANATVLLHITKKSCNSVKSYYWQMVGHHLSPISMILVSELF
jgi:hypothetical protein